MPCTTTYGILANDLGEAMSFDVNTGYLIVEQGGVIQKIKASVFWQAAELANQYTAANFNDISNTVNVTGKFAGKMSYSTTASVWVYAAGGDPGDVWNKVSDDSTLYTPT